MHMGLLYIYIHIYIWIRIRVPPLQSLKAWKCMLVTDAFSNCIWCVFTDRFNAQGGHEVELFAGRVGEAGCQDIYPSSLFYIMLLQESEKVNKHCVGRRANMEILTNYMMNTESEIANICKDLRQKNMVFKGGPRGARSDKIRKCQPSGSGAY